MPQTLRFEVGFTTSSISLAKRLVESSRQDWQYKVSQKCFAGLMGGELTKTLEKKASEWTKRELTSLLHCENIIQELLQK